MPKGHFSNARRRMWTEAEHNAVEEMIERGLSSRQIARKLQRTENSVHVFLARRVKRRDLRPLSGRRVADMLGVGCEKTVTHWIEVGWLRGHRGLRAGPNRRWHVREANLIAFLRDPAHWQRWHPERITDRGLRLWAEEIRVGHRFLTPGEVGERFHVQSGTVHQWIRKGYVKAQRNGNWWIDEAELVDFVVPLDRPRWWRGIRAKG